MSSGRKLLSVLMSVQIQIQIQIQIQKTLSVVTENLLFFDVAQHKIRTMY